ncbi:MAG: hypothetical protein J4F28_09645 [Nitrosopumilaceae archaeon]|nr:hypothetical protein [Nitrosopumilaceae archaeon]
MSKPQIILVSPGSTIGGAVRKAGMSSAFFSAPKRARRASDVRPQGRPHNTGCPTCSIEGMGMLRKLRGSNMCDNCRREAEY